MRVKKWKEQNSDTCCG